MAAAQVKAYIAIRAPAYSTESRLDSLIEYALSELSASVLGDQYDKAVALLVMHQLAKEASDESAGGPIVAKREGDLSVSYARSYAGQDLDDLDATNWGRELKLLIKSNVFPVMNRVSGYG